MLKRKIEIFLENWYKNKDHSLKGDLNDFRECHIEPDWILLYQYFEDTLILSAVSTGSQSDILKI